MKGLHGKEGKEIRHILGLLTMTALLHKSCIELLPHPCGSKVFIVLLHWL
jgi:hypothetical protein